MSDFINVVASYNKIYNTYIDEHEIVIINDKEASLGKIGTIVAGDSNSQFITFEINRYYDNIDLSNKIIKINYVYEIMRKIILNEDTVYYSDYACNICYNDEKIRFSWLLPADSSLRKGTIAAAISFIGHKTTDFNDEGYNLQTKIFELTIEQSISDNKSLEQVASVNWFSDIESRIYKVEQATGSTTLDYLSFANKPSINGTELNGNITLDFVSGIASNTNLGGVKAIAKTTDMTYPIGIDTDGFLWVKPGTGGGAGTSGADGFSPVVTMTPETNGTTLAILDKNGLKTTLITNGTNGTNGSDGISITNVDITSDNKLEVTLSDGNKITTTNAITVDSSSLIDDSVTSGATATWSADKIIAYVKKTMEDIENGTY